MYTKRDADRYADNILNYVLKYRVVIKVERNYLLSPGGFYGKVDMLWAKPQ